MRRFKFAAARKGEEIVYGAQRPGYSSKDVDATLVSEWISFMQQNNIRRVCCMLPPNQLAYYRLDLLRKYCEAFGESNVCHAGIEDFQLCDPVTLETVILPFLLQSDQMKVPVVVHCSGGSGRTGHVLAAWLVRHRGLTVDDALAAVASTCRDPREAVECGNATEQELHSLLAGPNKNLMREIVRIFETGDISQVAALVDAQYVDHQGLDGIELKGADGFSRIVTAARNAFSDLQVSIEDLIAEDDRVVARLFWHGTRPTGEPFNRETIDIVRFAGGRAIEHWGTYVFSSERRHTDNQVC